MDSAQINQIVEPDWLGRPATEVAPDLLGCTLIRQFTDGQIIRGIIVETEAYTPGDPAFHAYQRCTERNKVVFGPAGRVYTYLIYGMYHCFNVVTDQDSVPSAVLIRALQIDTTDSDSKKAARIAAGPGKLCRVLQIDRSLNGNILQLGGPLWLERRSSQFQQQLDSQAIAFVQTTRVGLTQGTELPRRWYISNCPAVSKL